MDEKTYTEENELEPVPVPTDEIGCAESAPDCEPEPEETEFDPEAFLENQPIELHKQKVFGMQRFAFWGVLFGYGGGLMLAGVIGMLFKIEIPNNSVPGIIGAVVGYFLGLYITKKLDANSTDESSSDHADS